MLMVEGEAAEAVRAWGGANWLQVDLKEVALIVPGHSDAMAVITADDESDLHGGALGTSQAGHTELNAWAGLERHRTAAPSGAPTWLPIVAGGIAPELSLVQNHRVVALAGFAGRQGQCAFTAVKAGHGHLERLNLALLDQRAFCRVDGGDFRTASSGHGQNKDETGETDHVHTGTPREDFALAF